MAKLAHKCDREIKNGLSEKVQRAVNTWKFEK
jgi:hypothetical protein